MSRIEFIKADKWRVMAMLLLTAALPFMKSWHNPNGMQPIVIFGFLTVLFWVGFIGMMLVPDSTRAAFFGRRP